MFGLLHSYLKEDNFGIGSKCSISSTTNNFNEQTQFENGDHDTEHIHDLEK
jgi:hypothetical protein